MEFIETDESSVCSADNDLVVDFYVKLIPPVSFIPITFRYNMPKVKQVSKLAFDLNEHLHLDVIEWIRSDCKHPYVLVDDHNGSGDLQVVFHTAAGAVDFKLRFINVD